MIIPTPSWIRRFEKPLPRPLPRPQASVFASKLMARKGKGAAAAAAGGSPRQETRKKEAFGVFFDVIDLDSSGSIAVDEITKACNVLLPYVQADNPPEDYLQVRAHPMQPLACRPHQAALRMPALARRRRVTDRRPLHRPAGRTLRCWRPWSRPCTRWAADHRSTVSRARACPFASVSVENRVVAGFSG